jgi:hypothetical protein
LQLRCQLLAEVVRVLQPLYLNGRLEKTQIDLLETLIGAAVWYLPQFKSTAWTGHISVASLESCQSCNGSGRPRLSEEHLYPRKLTGAYLLSKKWDTTPDPAMTIQSAFLTQFGRFCYVTKTENKKLVNLQRKGFFTNAQAAYEAAGIRFIKISPEELRAVNRRDDEVISQLLKRIPEMPTFDGFGTDAGGLQ